MMNNKVCTASSPSRAILVKIAQERNSNCHCIAAVKMLVRNIRQLATMAATKGSKFATQEGYAWFLPVQTRWKVSIF